MLVDMHSWNKRTGAGQVVHSVPSLSVIGRLNELLRLYGRKVSKKSGGVNRQDRILVATDRQVDQDLKNRVCDGSTIKAL